jgi:hypothetical protein
MAKLQMFKSKERPLAFSLVPVDVAVNFGAENAFARCPTCKMGRLEIDDNPDLCAVDKNDPNDPNVSFSP